MSGFADTVLRDDGARLFARSFGDGLTCFGGLLANGQALGTGDVNGLFASS
jgi:hypothetical protein